MCYFILIKVIFYRWILFTFLPSPMKTSVFIRSLITSFCNYYFGPDPGDESFRRGGEVYNPEKIVLKIIQISIHVDKLLHFIVSLIIYESFSRSISLRCIYRARAMRKRTSCSKGKTGLSRRGDIVLSGTLFMCIQCKHLNPPK